MLDTAPGRLDSTPAKPGGIPAASACIFPRRLSPGRRTGRAGTGFWLLIIPALWLCGGVAKAACEDLLADPPDVPSPPPIEINETCNYDSRTLDLTNPTYINNGIISLANATHFSILGNEFINNGEFFNLGLHDSHLGPQTDRASTMEIKGPLLDTPGVIGRFVLNGMLYNGPEAIIVIDPDGSLEGIGGQLDNRGSIYNVGQVDLAGSIDNRAGEIVNQTGALFRVDSVYNRGGEITNQAGANWVIDGYLGGYVGNIDDGIFNNDGSLTNHGSLENSATVNNSGSLLNLSGIYLQAGALNLTDGILQNEGHVDFNGGTLSQTGGMLLNRGDMLVTQSDFLFSGGIIENHGILTDGGGAGALLTPGPAAGTIRNYGTFDVGGSIVVSGLENADGISAIGGSLSAQSVSNTGGQLIVGDTLQVGQSLEITDGEVDAHRIELGVLATVNLAGGILGVDEFIGDLVNTGGTLAPGASPGHTSISGDYLQLLDATLQMEIGGLSPGVEYDTLSVGGTATLGGTLEVSLFDFGTGPFSPAAGDSFDILSAETLVGEFDILSLAMLDGGLDWNIEYILSDIGTDYVRLVVSSLDVSTVPVPASIWLFSTALIGFLGYGRRRLIG